jgi:hypothetical protein
VGAVRGGAPSGPLTGAPPRCRRLLAFLALARCRRRSCRDASFDPRHAKRPSSTSCSWPRSFLPFPGPAVCSGPPLNLTLEPSGAPRAPSFEGFSAGPPVRGMRDKRTAHLSGGDGLDVRVAWTHGPSGGAAQRRERHRRPAPPAIGAAAIIVLRSGVSLRRCRPRGQCLDARPLGRSRRSGASGTGGRLRRP